MRQNSTPQPRFRRVFLASLTFTVLCLGSAAVARADTILISFSLPNGVVTRFPPPAPNLFVGTAVFTTFGTAQFSSSGNAPLNPDGTRSLSGTYAFDFGSGNSFTGTITGGTGIFSMATGALAASASMGRSCRRCRRLHHSR